MEDLGENDDHFKKATLLAIFLQHANKYLSSSEVSPLVKAYQRELEIHQDQQEQMRRELEREQLATMVSLARAELEVICLKIARYDRELKEGKMKRAEYRNAMGDLLKQKKQGVLSVLELLNEQAKNEEEIREVIRNYGPASPA